MATKTRSRSRALAARKGTSSKRRSGKKRKKKRSRGVSRGVFRTWLGRLFSLPGLLVTATLVLLLLLAFDLETIDSTAMRPGLAEGDLILVDRAAAEFGEPQEGDVVMLRNPDDREREILTRVVAIEDDIVRVEAGEILINGQPIARAGGESPPQATVGDGPPVGHVIERNVTLPGGDEHRVLERTDAIHSHRPPAQLTVPRDHIWVLGDNRDAAYDSRSFGAVPIADVTGKVRLIVKAADGSGVFGQWLRLLD